jgi:hypothetical protein
MLPPPAFPEELLLEKGVIAADTVWSGTVLLKGQIVVKKGATLTILPGTVVRFLWSDEDGDAIGDGELNVEGRLLAEGTRERPIVFTSARETPAMKDWTFVMISTSKDSVLAHCVLEYAFTGVQIHYSTCTVRDCLFRRNWEGLRFSTTRADIHHNDFLDNGTGIYYQSHGSPVTVTRNRFAGNGYAVFAPIRCSSTVEFSRNNFEGSLRYQVNLGDEQVQDLDFRHNWWGSADREVIQSGIFDRHRDARLGRVIFEPFLTGPEGDCGRR